MELLAALAQAFPGYTANLASSSYLLGANTGRSRSVGAHSSQVTAQSLPVLEHAQRAWEGGLGQYPITLAFLRLTETLVTAGVNEACVKVCTSSNMSEHDVRVIGVAHMVPFS